tara:strand:- start:467 stop:1075 length:609 start_codon:yes stop_codon:yes gene_type:complete
MNRLPQFKEEEVIENKGNLSVEIKDTEELPEELPLETSEKEAEELISIQDKPRVDTREVFKNNKETELVVQKIKKPKREISDAQRENLRKAREKALIVRKQKKAERDAEKSAGTSLVEKKDFDTPSPPVPIEVKVNKQYFSEEHVKKLTGEATKQALIDYDNYRQVKKKEKKEKQKIEKHRQEVAKKIQSATKVSNPYDFCY